MPVLFGVLGDRRIPFERASDRIERDRDVMFLETPHDAPNSRTGAVVKLRLHRRITFALLDR